MKQDFLCFTHNTTISGPLLGQSCLNMDKYNKPNIIKLFNNKTCNQKNPLQVK